MGLRVGVRVPVTVGGVVGVRVTLAAGVNVAVGVRVRVAGVPVAVGAWGIGVRVGRGAVL